MKRIINKRCIFSTSIFSLLAIFYVPAFAVEGSIIPYSENGKYTVSNIHLEGAEVPKATAFKILQKQYAGQALSLPEIHAIAETIKTIFENAGEHVEINVPLHLFNMSGDMVFHVVKLASIVPTVDAEAPALKPVAMQPKIDMPAAQKSISKTEVPTKEIAVISTTESLSPTTYATPIPIKKDIIKEDVKDISKTITSKKDIVKEVVETKTVVAKKVEDSQPKTTSKPQPKPTVKKATKKTVKYPAVAEELLKKIEASHIQQGRGVYLLKTPPKPKMKKEEQHSEKIKEVAPAPAKKS